MIMSLDASDCLCFLHGHTVAHSALGVKCAAVYSVSDEFVGERQGIQTCFLARCQESAHTKFGVEDVRADDRRNRIVTDGDDLPCGSNYVHGSSSLSITGSSVAPRLQ